MEKTMKAAVIAAAGEAPVLGDFPEPEVSEGRELVELVAAGIHPVVRSLASGAHYGSAGVWPSVPGVDAVARTADGELVYTGYPKAPFGTLAERMSVPARMRIDLPEGADPVQVAGGLNPGLASWMPLVARADDGPLGCVLVVGATGVAGQLAVQNALALGVEHVVAVGRSPERLALLERDGVSTVALTGDQATDAAAVSAALAGTGLAGAFPSIVLDFVWGAPAEAVFEALGRTGLDEDEADIRYVEIGAMAGARAAVPAALLRSRRIRIVGSGAGSGSVADIMAQLPGYLRLIADGTLTVPTRSFPLSRVSEAWATAAEGGDRVVVVPDALPAG